jgi:hypothetical protein
MWSRVARATHHVVVLPPYRSTTRASSQALCDYGFVYALGRNLQTVLSFCSMPQIYFNDRDLLAAITCKFWRLQDYKQYLNSEKQSHGIVDSTKKSATATITSTKKNGAYCLLFGIFTLFSESLTCYTDNASTSFRLKHITTSAATQSVLLPQPPSKLIGKNWTRTKKK